LLETRHALSLHGCYPIVLILKMFSHAGAIRLLRFGFSKNVWFLTRSGKPLEPDLNTVNAIHLEQRLNFAIKHVVCNFITAAKQALGNNLKLMIDNVYAIYAEDVFRMVWLMVRIWLKLITQPRQFRLVIILRMLMGMDWWMVRIWR